MFQSLHKIVLSYRWAATNAIGLLRVHTSTCQKKTPNKIFRKCVITKLFIIKSKCSFIWSFFWEILIVTIFISLFLFFILHCVACRISERMCLYFTNIISILFDIEKNRFNANYLNSLWHKFHLVSSIHWISSPDYTILGQPS